MEKLFRDVCCTPPPPPISSLTSWGASFLVWKNPNKEILANCFPNQKPPHPWPCASFGQYMSPISPQKGPVCPLYCHLQWLWNKPVLPFHFSLGSMCGKYCMKTRRLLTQIISMNWQGKWKPEIWSLLYHLYWVVLTFCQLCWTDFAWMDILLDQIHNLRII